MSTRRNIVDRRERKPASATVPFDVAELEKLREKSAEVPVPAPPPPPPVEDDHEIEITSE
jgi:hypothetical protein